MKNKKAFNLILLANIVSGFAQGISMLSIPWYYSKVVHQESFFGWAYLVVTIISLFWSMYCGTLIDKYNRKTIFIYLNVVGGIILLSVSALMFGTQQLNNWLILLVFATTIMVWNMHYPALYALGHELMEKDNFGKFNSALEIQGQSTTIAAGAVGAMLLQGVDESNFTLLGMTFGHIQISKWDLNEIFLMDGITYLLAIILISMVKYSPLIKEKTQPESVITRLVQGFAYLKNNKATFVFGLASYSIFAVLLVEVHLLLAWYVNNHLGKTADVYSFAEIFYSIGALFAGIAIRKIFAKSNTVKAVLILMAITTIVLMVAAGTKSVIVFYMFSLAIGVTNAGTRVLRLTWLFNKVPNHLMGRVGGVFGALNIFQRMVLIAVFSIPFFSIGSHVTLAYFISGVFILLNFLVILKFYKKLI